MKPYEKKERNKQELSFNEFYTTYEQANAILGSLKSQGFLDNITSICCPCDGANSNIVKWLQNNTSAKIVYFDYLDCNGSKARKKMLQCGCVITNPPFSMDVFAPLLAYLRANKIKYFLWGPIPTSWGIVNKVDYFYSPISKVNNSYVRPNGEVAQVNSTFFTLTLTLCILNTNTSHLKFNDFMKVFHSMIKLGTFLRIIMIGSMLQYQHLAL